MVSLSQFGSPSRPDLSLPLPLFITHREAPKPQVEPSNTLDYHQQRTHDEYLTMGKLKKLLMKFLDKMTDETALSLADEYANRTKTKDFYVTKSVSPSIQALHRHTGSRMALTFYQ